MQGNLCYTITQSHNTSCCDSQTAAMSIVVHLGAKANTALKTISLVLSMEPIGLAYGSRTFHWEKRDFCVLFKILGKFVK